MPESIDTTRPRLLLTARCAELARQHVAGLEAAFEMTVLSPDQLAISPLTDGFEAICSAFEDRPEPSSEAPWAMTHSRPIPLLVVGAHGDPRQERVALESGAWDVVSCLAPLEILVARIRRSVELGRVRREQAAAIERLSTLTMTDEVTGLHNQRYLRAHLEESFAAAQRYEHPLSIVALDIDHFKEVNDSADHIFGTFILIELGRLLRAAFRRADILCRFGGDEFFAILPHVGLDSALVVAERIRKVVARHEFSSPLWTMKITASFGVSSWPEHSAESGEELLRLADAALFASKRAGRDRCLVATGEPAGVGE